jgi:hypothetical protein
MQHPNEDISYDLDFYNFAQYPQNTSKYNINFQANTHMQYLYISDDKYLNHVFKYCLSEQVQALCNTFILLFFSLFLAFVGSIAMATMWVGATT